MARTRTLPELEDDLLWQVDREGAWLRNESDRVRRMLNQSIAEFKEAVSENGHPYFLRATSGTLAVGPTAPFHFATINLAALSPAHHRVYGIDIKVGAEWKTLDPGHFQDRNVLQQPGNGEPRLWFEYERNTVAYTPASASANPYLLWDLPVHQDLAEDGDAFDGLNGWEEWVIFNAGAKLLLRDRDAHLAEFQAERQRLLAVVLKNAPQRQRAGAIVRNNVQLDRRPWIRRLQEIG